jgi:TatD DNase family protein
MKKLDDLNIKIDQKRFFSVILRNSVHIDVQIDAFESQLKMARRLDMPVVIHCRDCEDITLILLKRNLSATHRIHLHCFTGGWAMAEQYLKKFENLCIGVTPLCLSGGSGVAGQPLNKMRELVMHIPLDKLLLETDAPYFVPRGSAHCLPRFPSEQFEYSHPAFVCATAQAVASIRQVSLQSVLDANRKNVRKIYGF